MMPFIHTDISRHQHPQILRSFLTFHALGRGSNLIQVHHFLLHLPTPYSHLQNSTLFLLELKSPISKSLHALNSLSIPFIWGLHLAEAWRSLSTLLPTHELGLGVVDCSTCFSHHHFMLLPTTLNLELITDIPSWNKSHIIRLLALQKPAPKFGPWTASENMNFRRVPAIPW